MIEELKKGKKQKLWYTRRSGKINGPFLSGTLRRFILLGRVKPTDQISLDRKKWQGVMEVPEVVPPEVRKAAAEGNLDVVLPIQLREDERDGRERRGGNAKDFAGQRKGQRRKEEPELVQRHRNAKSELRKLSKIRRRTPYIGMIATSLLVLVLMGVGLYIGRPDVIPDPDCSAQAGPGVNWRNCRLDAVRSESANLEDANLNSTILRRAKFSGSIFNRADMRYADLSGSDLSYAEFSAARMIGINLQGADLTNADLNNSDLTYANLSNSRLGGAKLDGAKLEKAIWIDGSVCGPGSVGRCVRPNR
ncbi:MAG: pentapeptide repeat-containing protein [Gammaproteobacteria bacterium]|nr:pentapeptide repeat-containing protein [Gammaproteobacteria bacterium]